MTGQMSIIDRLVFAKHSILTQSPVSIVFTGTDKNTNEVLWQETTSHSRTVDEAKNLNSKLEPSKDT